MIQLHFMASCRQSLFCSLSSVERSEVKVCARFIVGAFNRIPLAEEYLLSHWLSLNNGTIKCQGRDKHLLSEFFISCFTQVCKDDPSVTTEMYSYKKKNNKFIQNVQPAGREHVEEDEVQREAYSQSIIIINSALLGWFGTLPVGGTYAFS